MRLKMINAARGQSNSGFFSSSSSVLPVAPRGRRRANRPRVLHLARSPACSSRPASERAPKEAPLRHKLARSLGLAT